MGEQTRSLAHPTRLNTVGGPLGSTISFVGFSYCNHTHPPVLFDLPFNPVLVTIGRRLTIYWDRVYVLTASSSRSKSTHCDSDLKSCGFKLHLRCGFRMYRSSSLGNFHNSMQDPHSVRKCRPEVEGCWVMSELQTFVFVEKPSIWL